MAKWMMKIFRICCIYKRCYSVLFILSGALTLFYLDQTFTFMPNNYIGDKFSNVEWPYIEIYDNLIVINKTRKKILIWTPFFKSMYWESAIKEQMFFCDNLCEVTSDRTQIKSSDAVLFHHGDLIKSDLPFRFLHQPWVLFTLEPTTLIQGNVRWWGKIFNWTMSYRRYSTIFNPYGYAVNKSTVEISNNEAEFSFKNRTQDMFAVISRCHDDARRYKIIEEFKPHFKVDIFGRCGKLQCNTQSGDNCRSPEEIHRYKFKLAFENGNCRDYITEKYWGSLLQDVVPIVNWKKHQCNENVIPNSYINVYDHTTIASAIQYIKLVSNNETLYNYYHQWKQTQTAMSSIFSGFCKLCEKLNQPFQAQVYKDLDKWFKDDICNKYNLFDGVYRHVDRFLFHTLH